MIEIKNLFKSYDSLEILKGINMKEQVTIIMNCNPKIIHIFDNQNKALEIMKKSRLKHLPVIDNENKTPSQLINCEGVLTFLAVRTECLNLRNSMSQNRHFSLKFV